MPKMTDVQHLQDMPEEEAVRLIADTCARIHRIVNNMALKHKLCAGCAVQVLTDSIMTVVPQVSDCDIYRVRELMIRHIQHSIEDELQEQEENGDRRQVEQ